MLSASNPLATGISKLGTEEKTKDDKREDECSTRQLHSEKELETGGATGQPWEHFTDVRIGIYTKFFSLESLLSASLTSELMQTQGGWQPKRRCQRPLNPGLYCNKWEQQDLGLPVELCMSQMEARRKQNSYLPLYADPLLIMFRAVASCETVSFFSSLKV